MNKQICSALPVHFSLSLGKNKLGFESLPAFVLNLLIWPPQYVQHTCEEKGFCKANLSSLSIWKSYLVSVAQVFILYFHQGLPVCVSTTSWSSHLSHRLTIYSMSFLIIPVTKQTPVSWQNVYYTSGICYYYFLHKGNSSSVQADKQLISQILSTETEKQHSEQRSTLTMEIWAKNGNGRWRSTGATCETNQQCSNGSGRWGQGCNGEIRNPFSLTTRRREVERPKKQSPLRLKRCVGRINTEF